MKLSTVSSASAGNTFSLEDNLSRLAMESEYASNLISMFRNTIPNFINAITSNNSLIKGFIGSNDAIELRLSDNQKKAIDASSRLDWLSFGERIITVPENFEGTLIKYIALLDKVTKELYTLNHTITGEYNVILSAFLTNKENKISLKDHTEFFKRIERTRNGITKELGSFIKVGKINKVKLRTVVQRAADLEELIKVSVALNKVHNKEALINVHNSVNASTDLLDNILKQSESGDINNISPAAAMNISKGAYEVAKFVELFGIVYYDVTVLLTIVDSIVNAIIEPDFTK